MNHSNFGYRLSLLGAALGVLYLASVGAVFAFGGGLPPAEPYQSLISLLTLITAPALVLLWAVIYEVSPAHKRVFSLGALGFIVIFAALTSLNRFTALAMIPNAIAAGKTAGLEWFMPYGSPSLMATAEMLAWGFYLGLACLCLAPVFDRRGLERGIFWSLLATGFFSLVSALGLVLNSFWLNLMGLIAWGPGLLLFLVLLAVWFRRNTR